MRRENLTPVAAVHTRRAKTLVHVEALQGLWRLGEAVG